MKPEYKSKTSDQALAHLIEECGEVIAAYGKMQRWGKLSVNPELPPEQQETNIDWVKREIRDLQKALQAYHELLAGETWERLNNEGVQTEQPKKGD